MPFSFPASRTELLDHLKPKTIGLYPTHCVAYRPIVNQSQTLALFHVDVFTLTSTDVNLAWTANLGLRVSDHFTPLCNPAW